VVFGLGLGYHLLPWLAERRPFWVVEPDPAVARLALEHQDLTALLARDGLRVGRDFIDLPRPAELAAYNPSRRLHPGLYRRLNEFLSAGGCGGDPGRKPIHSFASTRKGNRPSYSRSAPPEIAVPLYEAFITSLQSQTGAPIQTGEFGAHMVVHLVNDGPVTIIIDSKLRELADEKKQLDDMYEDLYQGRTIEQLRTDADNYKISIQKDIDSKLSEIEVEKKRLAIFERDKWTCRSCFSTDKTLHVHHLFYFKDTGKSRVVYTV
jgi:hypothetical protein